MNSPIHVLLIEDEPIISSDLQFFLEKRGFHVLLATDANEAYTICQKNLPQFVVLNFYQKNAPDGFSFARRLRNEYPHIHFFFMTGARKQDLEKSPDYMPTIQTLHKPFTRKQLLAMFAHFIA